jgi:hypothetical protein
MTNRMPNPPHVNPGQRPPYQQPGFDWVNDPTSGNSDFQIPSMKSANPPSPTNVRPTIRQPDPSVEVEEEGQPDPLESVLMSLHPEIRSRLIQGVEQHVYHQAFLRLGIYSKDTWFISFAACGFSFGVSRSPVGVGLLLIGAIAVALLILAIAGLARIRQSIRLLNVCIQLALSLCITIAFVCIIRLF